MRNIRENNARNNVAAEARIIETNRVADVPPGWSFDHMSLCGDHDRIGHPNGHVYIIYGTSLQGDNDEYDINDNG